MCEKLAKLDAENKLFNGLLYEIDYLKKDYTQFVYDMFAKVKAEISPETKFLELKNNFSVKLIDLEDDF